MNERILAWDGLINARDLGGLPTSDGRSVCWRAVVRSDTPARLTAEGWTELYAYGIRTIITLRTIGMVENELDFTSPYPDIAVISLPIEDITDQDFLQKWAITELWGTPLYYRDALRRWPEKHAAVISAIARAQPGGVLYHCIRGHDRTGIISLLLLALLGVTPDAIIADYELSADPDRDALVAKENSSIPRALLGALEGLDLDDYLLAGGATQADLAAIRRRLLDTGVPNG